MKQVMKLGMGLWMILVSGMALGQAKVDDKRMEQDIEVAENILSTLIRQQLGKRNFFPMEVQGSYVPGYGVTLRLPQDGPFMFIYGQGAVSPVMEISGSGSSFSYSISRSSDDECSDCEREKVEREKLKSTNGRAKVATARGATAATDSVRNGVNQLFLEVAKNFLADYGDVISQLKPDERIVITNRSDEFRKYDLVWNGNGRRTLVSAEARVEDITQMKLGKMTRDQFLSKLKVMNTESTEDLSPDLEVFSSLLGRLYRDDLSKTYYSDGNVGYERLKDFGVIYYMRVYSSTEDRADHFFMPTLSMRDVSKEERDKRVKELYPKFESELKENLVEYGRTLKSLKDDEQVVLNIRLTKCTGCGIPSTLEAMVKYSALKDYNAGKATREATLGKVSLKKGGAQ